MQLCIEKTVSINNDDNNVFDAGIIDNRGITSLE